MQLQYTADELIQQVSKSLANIREQLDEANETIYDLEDSIVHDELAEDALQAQPDLLDALRAAEYALRLALPTAPPKAPSPNPALLPQSEPRHEIEHALKHVTKTLDQHLS